MKASSLTLFVMIAGLRLASAQAPSITSPPNNETVYAGGGVSFQVAASGSPLYYFWQLNGVSLTNSARISGANGAVLTITNVGAGDAGQYSCIVSNAGGAPRSGSATLTVTPVPPGLLYAETFPTPEVPTGTGFYPISNVGWYSSGGGYGWGLWSYGSGTSPAWFYSGGAGTATFYATTASDNGVSGLPFPSINVASGPGLTFGVNLVTYNTNTTAFFIVQMNSGSWYISAKSLPLVPGGQLYTQSFAPAATNWNTFNANTGTVGGPAAGSLTGSLTGAGLFINYPDGENGNFGPFTINADNAPTVTVPPTSQSIYAGGTVSFQVSALGSPLNYFWQRNGVILTNNTRISGANESVLTITGAVANDAGQYSCIVSNFLGTDNSSNYAIATLTVDPVPAGQPADTITVSNDVVLNTFSPEFPNPVGININFFTDNDLFLNPARPIADALKEMGVKYLRYPGGGEADFYFFAYPPFDSVAPHSPQSGPGSNPGYTQFFNADLTAFNRPVLDFDQFMAICQEVGAEPVVDVAFDSYIMTPNLMSGATTNTTTSTLQQYYTNAVEWVRYANIEKGYGVKYWMLGNETWAAYYQDTNGNWYGIPESDLIQNINNFSAGMKAVDPSIKVIMNGVDWLVSEYVTACSNSYDYICTSEYPLASVPIANYDDWATNRYDLVSTMESIVNVIDGSSLSASQKQSTEIWASEFGPYTWWANTWPSSQDVGHSMFNFDILGQELCNPRFGPSMLWVTRWMGQGAYPFYDALDDNNNLTSNGQSLAIWGNFLLSQMVQVSQVTGLTVYASYDPVGGQAYCYIINKTGSPRDVHLQFDHSPAYSVVRKAWMQGLSAYAASSAYSLIDATLSSSNVTVIPYSITVFQMSVAQTAPPAISWTPQSQTAYVGAGVSFAVATSSGTAPFTYQWQLNGTNLSNGGRISGATGPQLTIASLTHADAGNYSVMLANGAGADDSTNHGITTLKVNDVPLGCLYSENLPFVGPDPESLSAVGWAAAIPETPGRIYQASGGDGYFWAYEGSPEATFFYTTDGLDTGLSGLPFVDINPAAYPGLTLAVDVEPGWQANNVTAYFAVQMSAGGWYVNRTPIPVNTGLGGFTTYRQQFATTAASWNTLTFTSTNAAIGGPAGSNLSGSITGVGLVTTFTGNGGVLSFDNFLVNSVLSTAPTRVNFSMGAGAVQLSWPPDHLGWHLETNAVSLAVSNAWFPYPGSYGVTNVVVPVNSRGDVFFRLKYP